MVRRAGGWAKISIYQISHFVPTTHERLLKDPVCYELEKINHDKGGGKGAGGEGGGWDEPTAPSSEYRLSNTFLSEFGGVEVVCEYLV